MDLGNNIGAMTTKPYEAPEWTTKDSTHFEYTGNAGASGGINGLTTKPYDDTTGLLKILHCI